MITLNRANIRDKIEACWLGKNIGGTLGGPWEGPLHTHALTFYEPVPDESAPNDDLDLQLVWLHMLEERGLDPSVRTFAEYWERYACRYPWNEYGFCMRNFSRGIHPPLGGCFQNYYVDEMGSPIRSEIWACLHPADPQAAARMAWKDSAVDHANGEGMYGEMFWAAVESAAFVEKDPHTLIRLGLHMIPLSSHLARAIRDAVQCYDRGKTWGQARAFIERLYAGVKPCNAVPNHAFTIIGWLYGRDFGDALCKAVNCGYDTDCTGATLGSLLGILGGTQAIPARWIEPIGRTIKLHPFTGECNTPADIDELTNRTMLLTEKAMEAKPDIHLGETQALPADLHTRLFRNQQAVAALNQDHHACVELAGDREVWLHFGGEPLIYPGIAREVSLTMDGQPIETEIKTPNGWTCEALGKGRYKLEATAPAAQNRLEVNIGEHKVAFSVLGPEEATYPFGDENVAICPKCRARHAACICG